VQAYDGTYPFVRGTVPGTAASPFYDWRMLIQPYSKNVGILKCPSNTTNNGALYNGDCQTTVPALSVYVSYGWCTVNGNACCANGFSYGTPTGGPNEASLQNTASQLMVAESRTTCTDIPTTTAITTIRSGTCPDCRTSTWATCGSERASSS